MALNGLQGLDSKALETRALIFNLAALVEKGEVIYWGFFQQILRWQNTMTDQTPYLFSFSSSVFLLFFFL